MMTFIGIHGFVTLAAFVNIENPALSSTSGRLRPEQKGVPLAAACGVPRTRRSGGGTGSSRGA